MSSGSEPIQNLLFAIRKRDLPGVVHQSEQLAPLERKSFEGKLPLVESVSRGIAFVQQMVDCQADLDAPDADDYTALVAAIKQRSIPAANLLLDAGANPHLGGVPSQTPLSAAAMDRDPKSLQLMEMLLDRGVSVDHALVSFKGLSVATALYAAARAGNLEGAELLINRGADVNKALAHGSPLSAAAKRGDRDVVRLLLKAGADINAEVPSHVPDIGGMRPIEIATKYGFNDIVDELRAIGLNSPEKTGSEMLIADAWTLLEDSLSNHRPDSVGTLNGGATSEQLTEFQRAFDLDLPIEAVAYFERHDGQSASASGLVRASGDNESGFRLLSLTEASREWTAWIALEKGGNFAGLESLSGKGVRKTWYSHKWIPISSDGLGNHHCLDLDPSDSGRLCQVILLWHDRSERPLVASSLGNWLAEIARGVERRAQPEER